MSTDKVEVDGSSIPKYARVNVGIIGKFGESGKKQAPDGLTSEERMKNITN